MRGVLSQVTHLCQVIYVTCNSSNVHHRCLFPESLHVLRGNLHQDLWLLRHFDHHQVPHVIYPLRKENLWIRPRTDGLVDYLHSSVHILTENILCKSKVKIPACISCVFRYQFFCYRIITGTYALFKSAQGISHRPVRTSCYHPEGLLSYIHIFPGTNGRHSFRQLILRNPLEIQGHAPGADCRLDLLRISCGQYKNHILRRFFQCLKEGVLRRIRKHVNLVDNIYLVFTQNRWIIHGVN